MGKSFLRFFLIFIIIISFLLAYLNYFGLETNKFNTIIKNKTNNVNQNLKLEFEKTKIYFNVSQLNILVKLKKPKILIKNNEINLSKFYLSLSLKSFYTSEFLLEKVNVAFEKNDIKDLTKVTNIFLPKIINKQLNKIFLKGILEGEFIIPFNSNGKITNDYGFSGKISDASINITKKYPIRNLTTEIKHIKDTDKDILKLIVKKGQIYGLDLSDSKINLNRKNNEFKIKSLLRTSGKFDFPKIKKVSSLFNLNLNNLKDINGTADLKTKVNFSINKQFQIKDLFYSTEGKIDYLEMHTDEKLAIKQYLPNYSPKIIIKDTKIKVVNSNLKNITDLDGFIKVKDDFDIFKLKNIYSHEKKNYDVSGFVDLTNYKVKIDKLNYIKNAGEKSELNFNINLSLNKYYNIKKLNFLAEENNIYLAGVKLNKAFELENFKDLKIKTYTNGIKNNDFSVKKLDNILISGEVFDSQSLLKSLYKKNKKKVFSKNFSSELKINFKKTLTGTNDDVSNFSLIASINKGSFSKLSLKGTFSENEILEMSIYQTVNNKKTLQVISDRAKPFIKNFNFIKGFEGGKLEYESIISKKNSKSNLIITDFKISKVPALAKLLTLASLQGIADTLNGEGIRFDSFEMKSNTSENILNIEDALAMGPAVSILLNGYVDKGKIVSLRGTLIPATKLNALISKIPIFGNILVGKKSGEGVVGVSFKMKGPPKNIKTTVNPIKTLTPRFIVRAIEKIKNKK